MDLFTKKVHRNTLKGSIDAALKSLKETLFYCQDVVTFLLIIYK